MRIRVDIYGQLSQTHRQGVTRNEVDKEKDHGGRNISYLHG